jgi:hypothetical protein
MREEEFLEAFGCIRLPNLRLEILIKKGHGKIMEFDQRDLGARFTRSLGGDGGEFLVE